jgi:hypothetical protein
VKSLVGEPVIRVGGDQYFWEDAVICGALRGDWDALERETAAGQACLRRARLGHPIPDAEVDAAAAEFRYARDLVAAQDALAWLQRWGLERAEWMDCMRRAVARRLWAADLPRIVAAHAAPADEVYAAMLPSALCGGQLKKMAEALARRAAVRDWLREQGDATEDTATGELPAAARELGARGLSGLDDDRLAERGAVVMALEAAFRLFRERVVTPQAIDARVTQRRLDWIRFRSRVALFASDAMAREAALCVREDHLDLNEVAADAHVAVEENAGFLDQVPKTIRDAMLAAGVGELVGPVPLDGRFGLIWIDEKRVPVADDDEVRKRAEREVIERAVRRVAQERTRWQVTQM